MKNDIEKVYYSEEELAAIVKRLGKQISEDTCILCRKLFHRSNASYQSCEESRIGNAGCRDRDR